MILENFAKHGMALVLEVSMRSLPLLAVSGTALLCLRRASAALRHLVLLLTLAGLLLLPLLSSALPGWRVMLLPHQATVAPLALAPARMPDAVPPLSSGAGSVPPVPSVSPVAPSDSGVAPAAHAIRMSASTPWALYGFVFWLVGVGAVLTPVMAGLVCVWRIERRSFPITGKAVTGLAAELGRELGVRRTVMLRQSGGDDALLMPMTWGWLRPIVLLPPDAADWPTERLRVVLLHELAHVRRGDWLWQMLAHLTCALYWFHPGVWLAARGLHTESECACDDQVLSAGIPAPDYARHLVDVARTLSHRGVPAGAALPMATPQITGRVKAVLQKGTVRSMMTRKTCLLAGLLAAGVLAPLAVVRPAAQAQIPVSDSQKTDPAAVRLLDDMAAAYHTLKTYSGTEQAEGSGAMGMPYKIDLAYERPGKMTVTQFRSFGHGQDVTRHLLLDGKVLYETSSNDAPGRYIRATKPEKNYTLWQDALIIQCDVKFPLVMEMLEDSAFLRDFGKNPHTIISYGQPGQLDGVAVDTIIVKEHRPTGDGETVFQIGHADHLLRRVTSTTGPGPNQKPMTMTQTFTNIHADPPLPISTFVFTPPPGAVAVESDPGGTHADPAAVALMAQMYAASAALHSFSCERDIAEEDVDTQGKPSTFPRSRTTIAIQKPGQVIMVRKSPEGESRAIADGTTLYVTTTEATGSVEAIPGRYLKLGVGPDDPNRLVWLSRFGNLPQYIPDEDFMPNVILGWTIMPADMYDWKMGKPDVVDGEPVDVVTLQRGDPAGRVYDLLTLAISRRDHLLRQASEYQDPQKPFSRRVETYTNIQKNPVMPASLFVFTPPAGSVPVSTTEDLFSHHSPS